MEEIAPPSKDSLKTITWVVYGFWITGILIHFLPLIALIIALIKRKDAAGTIYASHLTWVMYTFVYAFVAAGVGIILCFTPFLHLIGFFILGLLGLWGLYRIIKGVLKMIDNAPIENATAFV